MDKASKIILQIDAGEDADKEELDQLTRQLRNEILEIDVDSVDSVKNREVPKGAKGVDAAVLGTVAVHLLPAVVPALIGLIKAWSMRGENRLVKIKTQIKDKAVELEYNPERMTPDDVKELVDTLTGTLK